MCNRFRILIALFCLGAMLSGMVQAQTFTTLGEDPAGDGTVDGAPDLKLVAYSLEQEYALLFIRLEFHNVFAVGSEASILVDFDGDQQTGMQADELYPNYDGQFSFDSLRVVVTRPSAQQTQAYAEQFFIDPQSPGELSTFAFPLPHVTLGESTFEIALDLTGFGTGDLPLPLNFLILSSKTQGEISDLMPDEGYLTLSEVSAAPDAAVGGKARALLYPNPAREMVTVALPDGFAGEGVMVRLFNNLGQEVGRASGVASVNGYSLDVSNLPAGLYHVAVSDGERVFRGEVMVR